MSELTKEARLQAFVDAVKRGAIVYAAPDVMRALDEWCAVAGIDRATLDVREAPAVPAGFMFAIDPRSALRQRTTVATIAWEERDA